MYRSSSYAGITRRYDNTSNAYGYMRHFAIFMCVLLVLIFINWLANPFLKYASVFNVISQLIYLIFMI